MFYCLYLSMIPLSVSTAQQRSVAMKKPFVLSPGDQLVMKKQHPCGNSIFKVLRSGCDVRLVCIKCNRDLMLPRDKVEQSVKKILSSEHSPT